MANEFQNIGIKNKNVDLSRPEPNPTAFGNVGKNNIKNAQQPFTANDNGLMPKRDNINLKSSGFRTPNLSQRNHSHSWVKHQGDGQSNYSPAIRRPNMRSNQTQFQDPADTFEDDNSNEEIDYNNNQERLAQAQKNNPGNLKQALDTTKKIAKMATPMGAVSLLGQINFLLDLPFVAAGGAAVLKDVSDVAFGMTFIIPVIFSTLCGIFIFMMLLLVGANGKKANAKRIIRSIMLIIGGGIIDSVPGLDYLPIETLTVFVIYVMTLVERKLAQGSEQENHELNENEGLPA